MTTATASTDLIELRVDGPLYAQPYDPADARAVALASFVQSDVQASEATAREWLDRLDRVERGNETTDEGTGNAFTLSLDHTGATIENAIFPDDPPVRLEHDELRRALEAVIVVLGQRRVRV